MILTLSETETYCRKALCAAGAAPGIDEEGGYAATWLAARGLPAFDAFAEALARWTGDPEASRLALPGDNEGANNLEADNLEAANLEAAGRSAVFIGRVLVDLAVAMAARAGRSRTLTVRNLAHPHYLLPHAADCGRHGLSFALAWTDTLEACRDQAAIGQAVIDHSGDLALHGEGWMDRNTGRTVTALLSCYDRTAGDVPPPPALPRRHMAADLEARFRASLARGLAVEDSLWDCVAGMAAQTHVPATVESRARGAGSTANDNE